MRARRLLQAKGVVFLGVIGLLIGLSIAIYNKTFTHSVQVVVMTDRAGLQLNPQGDVRMRGALIGRVESIDVENGHALVHLAINPDAARDIPDTVLAQILPTTIFGQRYVELVDPGGNAPPITDGHVIPVDDTTTSVELTKALDDLDTVLTAVHPQELSTTLQALATGLEGRGHQLGTTVVRLNHYLAALEPKLPAFVQSLRLLGQVANIYANASPDLLKVLGNTSVTANTVFGSRINLAAFYADLTALAHEGGKFFATNGSGIVESDRLNAQVMKVLAHFAPILGCTVGGLKIGEQQAAIPFNHNKLHLTVSVGQEMGPYTSSDHPKFGPDYNRGPTCFGLPDHVVKPIVPPVLDDGADHPGPLIGLPARRMS